MTSKETPIEKNENTSAGNVSHPEDLIRLASECVAAGRYEDALEKYQHALDLELDLTKRVRPLFELVSLLSLMGEADMAEQRAAELIELLASEAETDDVLFVRGMTNAQLAYVSTDQERVNSLARAALSDFNRLMEKEMDAEHAATVYTTAASMSNILDEWRTAITLCEKCLTKPLPVHQRYDCLYELMLAQYGVRDYQKVISTGSEALDCKNREDEKIPWIYYLQGLAFRETDNVAAALSSWETGLAEVKRRLYADRVLLDNIYIELGQLYFEFGEIDKSIEILEEALTFIAQDTNRRRKCSALLGQSYHEKGFNDEALFAYRRVMDSENASQTEKAEVCQGLGKVYFDLGEYKSAIDAFETARHYFSWDEDFYGDLLLWLGDSYEAVKNYDRARECYSAILESDRALQKYKAEARMYLDRLLAPQGGFVH